MESLLTYAYQVSYNKYSIYVIFPQWIENIFSTVHTKRGENAIPFKMRGYHPVITCNKSIKTH